VSSGNTSNNNTTTIYSEIRSEIEMLPRRKRAVGGFVDDLSAFSIKRSDCFRLSRISGRTSGGTGELEQFGCAVNVE